MATIYEWCLETLDTSPDQDPTDPDVLDHHHESKLSDLPRPGADQRIVLVRDIWNEADEDLEDRQFAYPCDGKLPLVFDGGAKVPARFVVELQKNR
tara:strand:+ start:1083 stop:1370 length:288 start_codon:yes stop_codon:yes gene_type:complete